jgi:hypothetical protein
MTIMEGCMHQLCRCTEAGITREGMTFCSEICADATISQGNAPGIACPCGHPECNEPGEGGLA